jgi:hypothetical protein
MQSRNDLKLQISQIIQSTTYHGLHELILEIMNRKMKMKSIINDQKFNELNNMNPNLTAEVLDK